MLPFPHEGHSGRYCSGCRCDACRAHHAWTVRDRRVRQKEGVKGPDDRLSREPVTALLQELRDRGLTWEQIKAATHVEVRDIRRITLGGPAHVTRKVAERVEAGYRDLMELQNPAEFQAKKLDGDFVRWMVLSLFARGWQMAQIMEESGTALTFMRAANGKKIQVDTLGKIEPVFLKHHLEWGPSRRTAVQTWRRGFFMSDCYDWERGVPDLRPIPGTLHPDLVMEAAIYKGGVRGLQQRVLDNLAALGQYADPLCARAAFARWEQDFGEEDSVGGSRVCHDSRHQHHVLPAAWR